VRAAYQTAVVLGPWQVETIGPLLYRVNARVMRATPAFFGFKPLKVWLRVGAQLWGWVVEGEIAVDDQEQTAQIFFAGHPTIKGG
jgi:hypothetical protein